MLRSALLPALRSLRTADQQQDSAGTGVWKIFYCFPFVFVSKDFVNNLTASPWQTKHPHTALCPDVGNQVNITDEHDVDIQIIH